MSTPHPSSPYSPAPLHSSFQVEQLEASDHGRQISALNDTIEKMRAGAITLLSALPGYIYATRRAEAKAAFGLTEQHLSAIQAAIAEAASKMELSGMAFGGDMELQGRLNAAEGAYEREKWQVRAP